MRELKRMLTQTLTFHTRIEVHIVQFLQDKLFGAALLHLKAALPQCMLFSSLSFHFRYTSFKQKERCCVVLPVEAFYDLVTNKAFAIADVVLSDCLPPIKKNSKCT